MDIPTQIKCPSCVNSIDFKILLRINWEKKSNKNTSLNWLMKKRKFSNSKLHENGKNIKGLEFIQPNVIQIVGCELTNIDLNSKK